MVRIIDRRFDSKNKSAVNRQRFMRRFKQQIRKAVSEAIQGRSIRDLENGEQVSIPARDLSEIPEVLECHMVAGGFDYLVKTRVADMTAYRRFLGEVLLALPGVRETHTYAVMEEVKKTDILPI